MNTAATPDSRIARSRRNPRLKAYDYAQPGAHFVTLCSRNGAYLFGRIIDANLHPSDTGRIVAACWQENPRHFPNVELDEFVLMPNHIHGVLIITAMMGTMDRAPTLGEIVRAFKARASRAIGSSPWQRNYHEHVIRNETDLHRVREYIVNNPAEWAMDRENPESGRRPTPRPSFAMKKPDDPWTYHRKGTIHRARTQPHHARRGAIHRARPTHTAHNIRNDNHGRDDGRDESRPYAMIAFQ